MMERNRLHILVYMESEVALVCEQVPRVLYILLLSPSVTEWLRFYFRAEQHEEFQNKNVNICQRETGHEIKEAKALP